MTTATPARTDGEFARRAAGLLHGMLHWEQLDALWRHVRAEPSGWYAWEAGTPPPAETLDDAALLRWVDDTDALLRREHRADYCGIVYADDPARPTLIKVYDPRHLGSFCSCGATPVEPLWMLSRWRPDVPGAPSAPAPRRGGLWQRLWSAGRP